MLWKKALVTLGSILFSFQVMAAGSALINGKEIKTRDQLHIILAKQLNFPIHYGRNLDALYDMLSSDYSGANIIKIKHVNLLKAKLGSEYIDGFVQAIMDAAQDNPHVILVLE